WNPTLTTIPRASDVSASTGTIGSAMTINISRKSSSFTHTVKYSFGSRSGTIATGVGTSVSWTPPNDLASVIPNATSGLGGITVETYNGSTKVGSKSAQLTLNVPSSMKPTFTGITLSDNNTTVQNLIPDGNTFVEILSLIKVTFNGGSGIQGSTIKGYKAELVNNNQTITSNGGAFGIIRKTGEITVRASVQDSRGIWSNTKDTKITLLEYFSPLNSFKVERSSSARTTLTVTRTAKIAPLTVGGKQLNKMTISFKTRPVGTSTWTTNNGAASGTFTTVSELLNSSANLAGTFAGTQSWEVYGEVEDLFDKTPFSAIISTDSVLISKTKNGVGVGKIRERGMLDVGGDIYANNQLIQEYALTKTNGRSRYFGDGLFDFNEKVTTGYYSCDQPLNAPTVGTGLNQFFVFVLQQSDNYLTQTATQKKSGRMFTRTLHGGAWTDWIEYAPLNSVVEFTAVNQTKTYTKTIPGPYGFALTCVRSGNIVTGTIDYTRTENTAWDGTANETIPVGWRPVTPMILEITAESSGVRFNDSYARLKYSPSGAITGRIKLTASPLWFGGSITWITTDPFPS
ncbi:DUF859 family phage minor structural protein, partial [Streptococcus gallolyticus]